MKSTAKILRQNSPAAVRRNMRLYKASPKLQQAIMHRRTLKAAEAVRVAFGEAK